MTATKSAACALALLLVPALAEAQPASANARAAQLLFDEAKALAEKHDYAAACPKFVQSHQLDPAGGTVLHAADCHEHQGKLATAWAEYNEALSFAVRAKRADRESIARSRIAELTPQLAKLHVKVNAATARLDGFGVFVDGVRVGGKAALTETVVPVDAGPHSVEVRATGYVTAQRDVRIADREEQTVELSTLSPAPVATTTTRESGPQRSGGLSNMQIAGIAVASAGAAGLVVGTVFGIRAAAIGDQSDRCTLGAAGNGCPEEAVSEQDSARTSGNVSTVAFVAGGVLAAGGAALFLLAPRQRVQVGLAGTGLMLRGQFE